MNSIKVRTSQPYNVIIGSKLLDNIAGEVSAIKKPGKCIIISDDIVWALYGERVKNNLIILIEIFIK